MSHYSLQSFSVSWYRHDFEVLDSQRGGLPETLDSILPNYLMRLWFEVVLLLQVPTA